MNEYLGPILVLVGIAVVTAILLFVRSKKKADNVWKKSTFDRAKVIMDSVAPISTPGNVPVYFESGADSNAFDFAAVDRGIESTFRKLECAGYPVDRTLHHPIIVVLKSELSPESRTPCFKVFIGVHSPYTNTEWDLATCPDESCDHYILAAGEMVAIGIPYGDIIVIPHPQGDVTFNERIVEYEWEHVGLAQYDGPRFEATKIHGVGAGHPILADCPIEGFARSAVVIPEEVIAKDVLCLATDVHGSVVK